MELTKSAIKTYTALSLDGFAAGPDGRPSHLALPTYEPGKTHGFSAFQAGCGAVAMGRTTFEPALTNPWWPWPGLRVYVLSQAGRAELTSRRRARAALQAGARSG
jgi:dihydrofolate reductase